MNLYKLTESHNKLLEMMLDPESDQQTLTDTLASINDAIEVKAENSIAMIQTLEHYEKAADGESKRLAGIASALKNRREWLKSYLKQNMETLGKDKLRTLIGTLAIQKNSRGAVTVDNPDIIPAQFIDIIPEQHVPNNQRIYEAFKAGQDVPGATYTVGTHLRVR